MSGVKNLLYAFAAPVIRFFLKNQITHKRIKGTKFRLYYEKSQHLGFFLTSEIEYEKAFSAVVLGFIEKGNLVFEIGSNIGQYSLLISEKIGEKGKLICVEPDSDNFAFLSFNIFKNRVQNTELIHMAVSNFAGQTSFYKDTVTGGRMGSLIKKYTGSGFQGQSEEVMVTTLKNLQSRYGIPDFIKVDAEGAEDLIFCDKNNLNHETIYLVEVRKETNKKIFSLFKEKGFSVYLLEQHLQPISHDQDLPDFGNLLITHKPLN